MARGHCEQRGAAQLATSNAHAAQDGRRIAADRARPYQVALGEVLIGVALDQLVQRGLGLVDAGGWEGWWRRKGGMIRGLWLLAHIRCGAASDARIARCAINQQGAQFSDRGRSSRQGNTAAASDTHCLGPPLSNSLRALAQPSRTACAGSASLGATGSLPLPLPGPFLEAISSISAATLK